MHHSRTAGEQRGLPHTLGAGAVASAGRPACPTLDPASSSRASIGSQVGSSSSSSSTHAAHAASEAEGAAAGHHQVLSIG